MQPKKQENRGGARQGAGRKPLGLREQEQDALVRAMKKMAKLTGKTPAEILAEMIYDPECKDNNKLKGLELYFKNVITDKTEIDVKTTGPTIGLPEVEKTPEAYIPKPEEMN